MTVMIESTGATICVDGVRCAIWYGHAEDGRAIEVFVRAYTFDVDALQDALEETARTGLPVDLASGSTEEARYGIPR